MVKEKSETSTQESILRVFEYFEKYVYPITLEEIWLFLAKKTTKNELSNALSILLDKKIINKERLNVLGEEEERYVRIGSQIDICSFSKRCSISLHKLKIAKKYINLISKTQLFELIGVSGSVSMQNAVDEHDIDLFAISKANNLFLARFVALILAQIMGLRRKRLSEKVKDKICLNLLFDRANITVPVFKRSLYTGHEVLQMKPVYVVGDCYKDFLESNRWVTDYFPNLDIDQLCSLRTSEESSNFCPPSFLEGILKYFQMWIIHRHRRNELITNTQLWFCDGEKKK